MALQSEVSPTIVGDPNKDTQIDGDTKSDENHSSQSTDDEADLEDGEIQESEEEEEKDFSNVSLKEALDQSCLQNIEQLVNQAKNAKVVDSPERSKSIPPRKLKRMADNYIDHDRTETTSSDQEKGWFPSSPKYKSKFSDKPIDYRMELEAYRGTPPSSPERGRRNRDDKSKRKKSSKKSKRAKKAIRRKDNKGQRVANFQKVIARGKICKFFKEGKCSKGSDCYFSHAIPSYKKKDLCKFYLNGHCNKGKDCLFMHSEFPCKFYHTGSDCYAKNDCRFSHAPLTEEMKKILADYLRNCHGDDIRHNRNDDRDSRDRSDHDRDRDNRDRDRKRPKSRSPSPKPPPPKRTCLLGSPPRHIREAEETRRWQEEMKMLQQQNHPSFEIHLCPNQSEMAPSEFPKPNFYQETLLNTPSPKKRPPMDAPFHQSNMDEYDEGSPSKVYVYDEDDFIEIDVPAVKPEPPAAEYHHWENVHNMPHPGENHAKPFIENPNRELDFTNDVKFDETTQFSEMESSTDYPPVPSPHSPNEDTSSYEPSRHTDNKQHPDDSTPTQAPPPPIVVPTHLPRKQQELFMRVLQHQRLNQANVGSSPEGNDSGEPQVKKEPENEPEEKFEMGIKESEWYTSEEEDDDDDDDNDGHLLKKLQQAPPKPQPAESKPAAKVDLLAIFNTIQQKTKEKHKGLSEIQQKHSSFWQNILGGVAASKASPPSVSSTTPLEPLKRRTLLPDPPSTTTKTEPATPAEPAAIKDPRLKNRDPRKLVREPKPEISIPKPTSIQELGSPPIKPITVTTSEQAKESIPYRLRGITAKPLNYTPYLHASQSNPSLLKDPRLRKHLQSNDSVNGNEKDLDIVKLPVPPKNAPPIPELLLKYEKPVAAINIFESTSSSKPAEKSDSKPSINVPVPVTYDPSDMKGRVPIPVISPLDSKLCISVPVAYDPVESKSRVPVPVAYNTLSSKSPAIIPTPVTYEPVDTKSRTPVPVTASYDPENLKFSSPVPVTSSYDPEKTKFSSPVPVTTSYDPEKSKFSSSVPVTASSNSEKAKFISPVSVVDSSAPNVPKGCAPVSKRRESGASKKRAAKSSVSDPRAKRRDSHTSNSGSDTPPDLTIVVDSVATSKKRAAKLPIGSRTKRRDSHTSNSGSDTPPHLTIVDNGNTPPQQELKSAPVLENELVEVEEKKQVLPILEQSSIPPPTIDEDILACIKREIELSSVKKQIEPTAIKKQLESTSSKKDIVLTSIKKKIESTSTKKEIESTSTKKEIESTSTKKEIESTSTKKEIESTSIMKEIGTTSTKKEIEATSTKKEIEATIIKKEIESDSDSNHDPPPHTSKASHKKSLSPPIVEQFMTVIKKEVPQDNSGDSKPVVPPLIIKKVKPTPTPASHLPKAIADPRMAKLHNPRRPRIAASNTSPRRVSERRKAALEAEAAIGADAAEAAMEAEAISKPSPTKSPKASRAKDTAEEKPKAVKSIPKKRRLSDKSEEKKKTVHRNRKSSMDYASPLNSCDATDSKSVSYNRYNQRPKRGVNAAQTTTGKDSPTTSAARSPSDSSSIPEFALSDSSNLECDNSNDVNLKDRFKTIDPTASPFC